MFTQKKILKAKDKQKTGAIIRNINNKGLISLMYEEFICVNKKRITQKKMGKGQEQAVHSHKRMHMWPINTERNGQSHN